MATKQMWACPVPLRSWAFTVADRWALDRPKRNGNLTDADLPTWVALAALALDSWDNGGAVSAPYVDADDLARWLASLVPVLTWDHAVDPVVSAAASAAQVVLQQVGRCPGCAVQVDDDGSTPHAVGCWL